MSISIAGYSQTTLNSTATLGNTSLVQSRQREFMKHLVTNRKDYKYVEVTGALNRGADVNEKDVDGNTPLHVATLSDSCKTVQLLIDRGAELDAPNFKGESCLHLCAQMNLSRVADVLIKAKANIDLCSSVYVTPLHVAAKLGQYEVLDVLLKGGANVNARTKGGDTPLHLTASNNHARCTLRLMEGGADLHARDDDCCMTPLATSCIYGWPCNISCFQLLDFEWKREGAEDGHPSVLFRHCEFNPAIALLYPIQLLLQTIMVMCTNRRLELYPYACKTTGEALYFLTPCGWKERRDRDAKIAIDAEKYANHESVKWAEQQRTRSAHEFSLGTDMMKYDHESIYNEKKSRLKKDVTDDD